MKVIFRQMTEQKPAGIDEQDWAQMPAAARAAVIQAVEQTEQLEAQLQNLQTQLNQNPAPDLDESGWQEPDEPLIGHLLVVDDNEMNRDILARRLQRQGHTVEFAVNGQEALAMVRAHRFDLVLLDIMMPILNGYETLERMKADPTLAHLPVIMISAIDELESIVRCITLGAEDYLPKPFNNTLLRARIGASLEKKRLRDRQEAYIRQLDIENRRKTAELEQARRIQRSMLPSAPPNLPYLDIAAYQETASEVGGDYYDFFPQADGRLYLAVGDATGHGVGSGLLVAMTKAFLLATNEHDLSVLVRQINEILNKIDLGVQLNMALLLLEVYPNQAGGVAVRVCGGGMPPIYILRTAGAMEEIMVTGLPLAVSDEVAYSPVEFELNSGDTMVLMSDGLSEMFNEQHEFLTFDRLTAAMAQIEMAGLTAAETLTQIASIGYTWAKGHPLCDDVTLVTMRVK